MKLGTHNVVAAFLDERKAQDAIAALEASGIEPPKITLDGVDESLLSKAEMREEVDKSWGGPSVGLATDPMVKGATIWTIAGAALGSLLGVILGLVLFQGAFGIAIVVIALGVAGATAGFVAGGFTKPRAIEYEHDEQQQARTDIGVHSDRQEDVETARVIFLEHGADRVERFDSEGNPVPELEGQSGYEVKPSATARRLEDKD